MLVGKRLDFLILLKEHYEHVRHKLLKRESSNIPFIPEQDPNFLISKTIAAVKVESESSL